MLSPRFTRSIHFLLTCAILLSSGLTTASSALFSNRALAQAELPVAVQEISITSSGFSPSELAINAGDTVIWRNNTDAPVTLQSGTTPTGQQVFLPVVQRSSSVGASGEEEAPVQEVAPVEAQGPDFTATIQPGGTFSQVFADVGSFPFFLSDKPQFFGRIIVNLGPAATPTPKVDPPTDVPPTDVPTATATQVVPTPTATAGPNQAPQLTPIGNRELSLGSAITFTLKALDPDNDLFSFSVEPLPLPNGANLNAKTGAFAFRPESAKAYIFIFTVTDSKGNSSSETVTINVTAPPNDGVTTLRGRLLDTNDYAKGVTTPIVNGLISLLDSDISALTDSNGYFLLDNIPPGPQILDMDVSGANPAPDGSTYAGFRETVSLIAGVDNVIERPFYLPRIATKSLTDVDPAKETTVSNPDLQISMVVPANTARAADGSLFEGNLSISEVPENLAPAALPEELNPALLITIQPVGVTFDTPVPLTFPNTDNLKPGTETDIWSLDPELGAFVVVGTGKVSLDGKWITTISGGVRAADWHLTLPPQPDPDGDDNNDNQDPDKCCDGASGSATALMNGNLEVDHELAGYQSLGVYRPLRMVYSSSRADVQPVVTSNVTIAARSAVPKTISAKISVSGVQKGVEVFVDTSSLNESVDEQVRQAIQFDGSDYETGMYSYRLSLTSNFGNGGVSSVQSGRLLLYNMKESPFGAGWGLDGFYRIQEVYSGDILMTEGNGGATLFNRRRASGELLSAKAAKGVPANLDLPSANIGQTIAIFSDPPNFTVDTNVFFSVINDNGVPGTRSIRVSSVSDDGKAALVVVPNDATTGPVYAEVGREAMLQIVPVLTGSQSNDFRNNSDLYLFGSGYVEGKMTIQFGPAGVVDNATNAGPDIYNANTNLRVQIPVGASGVVSLTTDGGVSNLWVVGPSTFTSIEGVAANGTPANPAQASTNNRQLITLRGTGFGDNTNVTFPSVDDAGAASSVSARVRSVSADGTSAVVDVPDGAVTGDVRVFGAANAVRLQIVPHLTSFGNGDFRESGTSRNLVVYGHGFVEGNMTALFGATGVLDPDAGPNTIDTYYSGTQSTFIIPPAAQGNFRLQTAGGTSNTLFVGPTALSAIPAIASRGTPANGAQASANNRQLITLNGSNFGPNTNVIFPTVDDNGIAGSVLVRVSSVSADRTSASVDVPDGATTGDVRLFGASGAVRLQIVPVLDSFGNGDFRPSGLSRNLVIYGHGYIEGSTTYKFGDVTLNDPDTGPNSVDVYYSGTQSTALIPEAAKGLLQVTTPGGTSNALAVGPTSFTGINAVAASGTPANGGQASANAGQYVTFLGANLSTNSNVLFPALDDSGLPTVIPVRVDGVAADKSSARVLVPNGAVTGDVTLFGATGSIRLQIVPRVDAFANTYFRPSGTSRDMVLYGTGFVEGGITINFGTAPVVDPNTGSATVDVYYSGTQLTSVIPNDAKGNLTVQTAGGTSAPIAVGPSASSSIVATANLGTPTNGGQASANVGQLIQINGSNLFANTMVNFPSADDSGVAGTIQVRVTESGADAMWASVVVPFGATTGNVTVVGATGSTPLQIVPHLAQFSYSNFNPGSTLYLYGGGFHEGSITAKFGGVNVVDPSPGTNTIEVYSTASAMAVTIPAGPGQPISVQTAGGTSNAMHMTDPNVALVYPRNNSSAAAGSKVYLQAVADDNSNIQYVDFLLNGSVVVSDTSRPYEGTIIAPNSGPATFSARARAIDATTAIQDATVTIVAASIAISATATQGTPANAGEPSANAGQRITILGSNLRSDNDISFPTVDAAGVAGTVNVRVENVSPDGTRAIVVVPLGARTGNLQLVGSTATARLQVVPVLSSFSNGDFRPSGTSRNLSFVGTGFVENGSSVLFGGVSVNDPDAGAETIDVYYSNGTGMNTIIPNGAQGNVRVQTEGGASNTLFVGPTLFSGIRSVAEQGTAANTSAPSVNVGQQMVISGTKFGENANVVFTSINDAGVEATVTVRVSGVSVDGTTATVLVPSSAKTGNVRVEGATGTFPIQIVPVLTTYSNGDFAPSGASRNMNLNGAGFVEGGITVSYGDVSVVDPDAGENSLDVYSGGDRLNVIIPENAKGNVTVSTAGGTSNVLNVGPTDFTSFVALAEAGTPANAGQASTNAEQLITVVGSNLTPNTNVRFVTTDSDGVVGIDYVRVTSVSADRTRATVVVPLWASTGDMSLVGSAATVRLQIVPRINTFSNSDFVPSGVNRVLQLEGTGFIEGRATINFGDIPVVDPDGGPNFVDSWNANRLLYTVIPNNAKGNVTVTTDGGTSNSFAVGPTAFTSLASVAQQGEPTNPGEPSANILQAMTIRGVNLNPNTNVIFPTVDDNGIPGTDSVRVHSVSADRTSATVYVPYAAATGNLTIPGVAGSYRLQIVPKLDSFSLNTFTPGGYIYLNGGGFIEGNNRIRFGAAIVNDPDTGSNLVESYSSGTRLYLSQIPAGAQSRVRVATNGGTSNAIDVAPAEVPTEYPIPAAAAPGTRLFVGPDGDFSTLVENNDGSFVRTMKDGTKMTFSAAGLQTAIIDRNGNTTSFGYDGSGNLTTITDPVGLVTTFAYLNGRVSTITDPTGRVTKLAHDGAGNLVSITDPDNTARGFGYDARHRLTAQTTQRGHTTQYQYNFAGMHVKSIWPDGSTRLIDPVMAVGLVDLTTGKGTAANPAPVTRPSAMLAKFTDGNGGVTTYKTDRYGAGTEAIDPLGRRVVTTRDKHGNPLQTIQPNGVVIDYSFDAKGNMLSVREASGTALARTRSFQYEPVFNLATKITDPAGFATTLEYDAKGNVVKMTNPISGTQTFTYDSRGLPLTMTDELGRTTTFTYDAKGNLQTVADPLGVVTEMERNPAGNVTGLIQAKGTPLQRKTSAVYDSMNRRTSLTDAAGAVESFAYDAYGNQIESKMPTGETYKYEYDSVNRTVKSISPIAGTTEYFYDGMGNVVRVVDAVGANTFIRYDAVYRPIQITDPVSGTLRFTYDVQDNVVTQEDARGKITRYEYDILSRQVKSINPLSQVYNFTYDVRDLLLTSVDPKGQTLKYSYDGLTRRTKLETPDDVLTFQFDAVGNLLLAQDNDSKVEFAYDGMDRQTIARTIDLGGQPTTVLTRTYDVLGRRTQLNDSAGGSTQFTYNTVDYLTSIQPSLGGAINAVYDSSGRPTKLTLASAAVSDYVYDVNGRLQSIAHAKAAGGSIFSNSFEYNAVGSVSKIVEGAVQRQYTYDPMQRLLTGGAASSPENYAYDPAGNRTTSSLSSLHTVDNANRLLEDAQYTYTYDANGNLATRTAKSGGALTTYTFNALDQLTRIEAPGGVVSTYRYDAVGRRIEKSVGGTATRYVYNGLNIRLEFNGSNQLSARYTHGDGIDDVLSMERGGAVYYYLTDHLGSVRTVVDAAGTTVNSYEYDSYGRRTLAQETVANPFSYTGREYDAESGLHYYRARYYNAETGRFISEDPLGLAGGDPNLYAYVRNNPVNLIDPSGLFGPWDVLDVLSFGKSLYDFVKCPNLENGLGLALDTIGLLPGIPGLGTVRRGADALDALRKGDKAKDALKNADNIPCSFTPDTLVTTENGLLPIAEIKVGDYVLAFDEKTGQVDYYPVSASMSKEDPVLIVLTVDEETIVTTPIHPFYSTIPPPWQGADDEQGAWKLAGDLQPGDQILRADGSTGTVQRTATVSLPTEMFDLTVEDAHSFFVGEEQWLVHNCRIPKDRSGKDFTPKGKQEVIDANKAKNDGVTKCESCGVETVPSQKSQKGVTPSPNETQVDHITPKSKGGAGSPENGQVLCRHCNRQKSDN